MVEPSPAPATVVNPLQWQIGQGKAPDGSKVCVFMLTQGLLTTQVVLNPHDTDALGRGLVEAAAQARTALIIPNGPLPDLGFTTAQTRGSPQ